MKRKQKTDGQWGVLEYPCPTIIKAYNKHMGGVDLSDQLIQYYSSHRKVARWYKTLFLHFLDIATTNAFILHKELSKSHNDQPMEHKTFLIEIAAALCGTDMTGRPTKKSSQHLPVPIIDGSTNATQGRKQCVACKDRINADWRERKEEGKIKKDEKKARGADTPWMCEACGVALCFIPTRNCFREYHKRGGAGGCG